MHINTRSAPLLGRINLDHNATTPVIPPVLERMLPFFGDSCGNPSSGHSLGLEAKRAVQQARSHVSLLAGADAVSVLFTSSATEAINWVIRSHTETLRGRARLVVTNVEHSAVLEAAAAAPTANVTAIRVDSAGRLDLEQADRALSEDTTLACVMWANNETGVVFQIPEIAKLCRERGIPLLVDAVQAAGKLSINVLELGIDYLIISAHKLYGPKGIAALIASDVGSLEPMLRGGGQERGLRAGTENVPAVVGFGEAAHLALSELSWRTDKASELRALLERELLRRFPQATINGKEAPRLCNTSNVWFDGTDSDALVTALDAEAVCVSSGSACHADTIRPSHVVLAMTGSYERAMQSVRFSVSHLNNAEEITRAVDAVERTISRIAPRVSCA